MYACFRSYYKHGSVGCVIVEESEMREYCLKELYEYGRRDDFKKHTLEQLIEEMIEWGNERINEQRGWAVRHVIKGDNLVEM